MKHRNLSSETADAFSSAPYSRPFTLIRSGIDHLFVRIREVARHPLFRLTLIGLAIRFLLAPITQFSYDPVVWYTAGNDMLAGLSPYYTRTYSYPPLWAYTYFPFIFILSRLVDPRTFGVHVSQMDWISVQLGYYSSTILSPLFLLTVKLPLILADLGTGLLIFKIVKGYTGFSLARKAYLFWFFNPFVIWTSSVHGAFDVLPAFFTLASLTLVLRRNYFMSGLSLAIATLYKLYPIYLAPLYAVLVWTNLGQQRRLLATSRSGLQRLFGFLLGSLVPALVALPFVSVPDMLHAVFARGGYVTTIGGLSLWMLNYTPWLGWLAGVVSPNLGIIQLATSAFALLVSLGVGLRMVRNGMPSLHDLFQGHLAAIAAIYVTLITVNPQYVIWILPFLAVTMFSVGMYRTRGLLLGGLAFLFQLGISGALIVLLPLTYLGVSADSLTTPVRLIIIPFGLAFGLGLTVFGVAGGLVLVSFLVRKKVRLDARTIVSPITSQGEARYSLRATLRSLRGWPTYFMIAFLVFTAASTTLARTSGSNQFLPFSINSRLNGNTLSTQASFLVSTGSLPLQLNIVAAPLHASTADQPVYIYYDPRYPTLGNDLRGWIGMTDHLPVELRLRGYTGSVQLVNATGLQELMSSSQNGIIVIPSGVFPLTVQNSTASLVGGWLRSGGTLVWMGGAFGFYSDMNRTGFAPLETGISLGSQSQSMILGHVLVGIPQNGTARIAAVGTRFSSALNLTYSDVWAAPTLGVLRSVGGLAIGHVQNSTDDSRSSISIVPVGPGKVILFGGPVTSLTTADGEDVVSHDLAQILSLGSVSVSAGIGFTTYAVAAQTSTSLSFTASFNVTSLNITGIVLAAFSDYSFSRLYWRMVAPVTH